jgi:hypothetical protein
LSFHANNRDSSLCRTGLGLVAESKEYDSLKNVTTEYRIRLYFRRKIEFPKKISAHKKIGMDVKIRAGGNNNLGIYLLMPKLQNFK